MKMIEHNHFICHLILGIFTEYPSLLLNRNNKESFLWYTTYLDLATSKKGNLTHF